MPRARKQTELGRDLPKAQRKDGWIEVSGAIPEAMDIGDAYEAIDDFVRKLRGHVNDAAAEGKSLYR